LSPSRYREAKDREAGSGRSKSEILHKYQFENFATATWKLWKLRSAKNYRTPIANKAYATVLKKLKELGVKPSQKQKYGLFSFLLTSGLEKISMLLTTKNKTRMLIDIKTHESDDYIHVSVAPRKTRK